MLKILTVFSLACICSTLFASQWPDMSDGQAFQKELDSRYFELNQGLPKLRHVLLHLMDSTGKVAAYCEKREHGKDADPSQIIDEVLPDLLMHTLQIANFFDADLGEKYAGRVEFIVKRAQANERKLPR